jgi:hypothetical protein
MNPATWTSPCAPSGASNHFRPIVLLRLLVAIVALAGLDSSWLLAATLDITKFGAVANDNGNDLSAFAAAIRAAKPGDTIVVPAGNFTIGGAIQPKDGIKIVGAGRDNTSITFNAGSSSSMISLGAASNVELAGFTLNANSNAFASQGIDGSGGHGEYIHDLRVENLSQNTSFGPQGIYFEGVTDNRIINNDFTNIGVNSLWGAGIRLGHGSSRTQVIGNTITDTGRGGILANDGTTDLVIRNNTVTGSGLAPNAPGLGIEIFGNSDRALVEGNHIDHWLSLDSSSQVAVRNNVITSNVGPAKYAGLEMAAGSHDNLFVGNTVQGGAQVGISVSGDGAKQHVLFANNTIQNSQTWGAQIQGDTGGAQQMYFYHNTFSGTVQGPNNLYPNQGQGFRFNGNATNINLDGNRIANNGNIGLQLGGTNVDQLTIVNNTITGNAGAAVTRDYSGVGPFAGKDLVWSNNSVSNNGNNFQLASVGFSANAAPTAAIVNPGTATVGQPVNFSFRFSDQGTLGSVLWDLGEGLPDTSANPSHVYTIPGKYLVELVVWDNAGRAAFDTMLVTVAPEPSSLVLAGIALSALLLATRARLARRGRN